MKGELPSDSDLMLQFASGDEQAFLQLFERFERRVLNYIFRYVANQAQAEELTQDVFLRVYKARSRYQATAQFSTWIYTIATNVCLKHLKRREFKFWRVSLPIFGDDEAPDFPDLNVAAADEQLVDVESKAELRRAIDALPDVQKAVVIMRCYQDMGHEEIATILQTSVSAVKSHLHRAYRQLAKLLRQL